MLVTYDVACAFRSMTVKKQGFLEVQQFGTNILLGQFTRMVPEAMVNCHRNCKQKHFLSMKQTKKLLLLKERDLCPRRVIESIYRQRMYNTRFYRYGGHIELLDHSLSIYARFSGQFFLKFC